MKSVLAPLGLLAAVAMGVSACSGSSSPPPRPAAVAPSATTIVGSKYPTNGQWSADLFVFLAGVDGQRVNPDGYRDWAMRVPASPGGHTLRVGVAQRNFLGGDDIFVDVPVTLDAGRTYRLRGTDPADVGPAGWEPMVWVEDDMGRPVSNRIAVPVPRDARGQAAPGPSTPGSFFFRQNEPVRPGSRVGSPFARF